MTQLDSFTKQYIATALWSSTDDADEPLDRNYSESDLAPTALEQIIADCAKFQAENEHLFTDENNLHRGPDCDDATERAGHDFWLTRNGHGVGFWDGGWEEPAATQLTNAAHAFGECDLYVGDDGKLYI